MINGEIVFCISDNETLEINMGTEILPTKVINKGDVIALGRRAPMNKWMFKIAYDGETEFITSLEKMVNQLYNVKEYVNELIQRYAEVNLMINMRSEFAEMGCSIPSDIIKKISELNCSLDFRILSFGMAINS